MKDDDDDIQEYKKPWVGLSDDEVAIYSNVFNGIRLVREIEAVLKERNTGLAPNNKRSLTSSKHEST